MQKYKKVKIVGKGSFGYAVLVQSRKTKKQYIMKIIDISKMDQKQIQQALMEVHLLKVLRYPYVVTYRQSFMEKMCLCIVMDYCQGGDMFNKIAKQKQLGVLFPQHQIVTWFIQMALAMNYVHDKKILHRDLKTQNIFLTSKGDIKIGDFGIARVLQHTYDCANTAIGTPYYLSPQICQQKPYNQKSDIWSLGCILYEIATLNHAFDAQNMKGLVQKILKGTYPSLPQMYSSDLKKLISEMLIKDPNKRPSIRKILQMPFMKAKISELFSNTLKTHQLQLQKQSTLKSEMFKHISVKPDRSAEKDKSKDKKQVQNKMKQKQNMFKKKQESRKDSRKIEIISKNNSQVSYSKKIDSNQSSISRNSKQGKVRVSLQQESTNRNIKQDLSKQKKPADKQPILKQNRDSSSKMSGKKSINEQEQTLQQQGYGVLFLDMKRCIKGETKEQQQQWKIEQKDKIAPKYLQFQQIPGYNQKDTVGSKIQALRMYLQKIIGNEFLKAYKLIQQDKDEDYQQVKNLLGPNRIKFIPLIVQLIVCEDNYY